MGAARKPDRMGKIEALLEKEAKNAVKYLSALMNDERAKPELRFKAAEEILDRVLEKKSAAKESTFPFSVQFEGVLDEWSE